MEIHHLWDTHDWDNATEEQIISALFNSPTEIHPFDMADIRRICPSAIRKYQNLFYGGIIPKYAIDPQKQ
jgi:hypothetical protein